jgi:hypothetical protein
MERRHRPYRSGGEPPGWVVAGAEDGWPPRQRVDEDALDQPGYGHQGDEPEGWYAQPYDPGYGGQRYGELPEPDYQAPAPEPGYLPPEPGYLPPEPAHPPEPAARYRAPRRAGPPPGLPPPPAEEPPAASWTPALLWTAGLFLVPVLAYLGWVLTLSGVAPAGCLDAAGAACPAPRTAAVGQLINAVPALAGALILGLLVALGIRRIAGDWHGFTVGFSAAVIGAGVATLVAAVAT